ncbi:14837_t:CDS:1, partial [Acaulospora colombiana]
MDKLDLFGESPAKDLISDFSSPNPPPQKSSSSFKLTLPPGLLLGILKYLPITSLSNFARACRRFKVLVYDDELWEHHLKTLGVHKGYDINENIPLDTFFVSSRLSKEKNEANDDAMTADVESLASTPSPVTPRGNLLDFSITKARSQRTLSLIPGLPLDPFSQKSRAASTGISRAIFKKIYTELLPYYIDFRNRRNDSRLFKEYTDPTEQVKMLSRLMTFSKLNISLDSDQ